MTMILWSILIGLVVGVLAKFFMPGRDPGGVVITMLLGMAGAVLASVVGRSAGWLDPGEGPGLIASVLGAIAILMLYRAARRS